MGIGLAIFAGILFILYFFYFFHIIRGEPQGFELELIKTLAEWMINRGKASRWQLWLLYLASALLEGLYFALVFALMANPVIRSFSIFFVSFEAMHLALVGINLARFFGGRIPLKKLFTWPVERTSAVLFFTHSMLVLINIFFFLSW